MAATRSPLYARRIGADTYAKDGFEAVRIAQRWMNRMQDVMGGR